MADQSDPKLLYAINNIKAYHIQDGEETCLTPSGGQTLSMLMVPTSSPFSGVTVPQTEAPDEDFYLHLNLPPELDLPMPATTQIYHQPPTSYLIPRWDMGPETHAFTRIEFPQIGDQVSQDDVDTFETILAQCTAFLERSRPPLPSRKSQLGFMDQKNADGSYPTTYNPADYAPGGSNEKHQPAQVVLIDEDNGSIVGELGGEASIHEHPDLKPGNKRPVEIQVSQDGKRIDVAPVSEEYLRMARHPAYAQSSIVQNAATASRLIVTSSTRLGSMLAAGADSFAKNTKPVNKPMEFTPAAHERVRKINNFTNDTAQFSSKTVGQAGKIMQNFAASATGHKKDRYPKGFDEKGKPLDKGEYKPGLLNKSMIAFSTVADGFAESGKALLTTSGAAASSMVGHRYGEEAGSMAKELAGGVKNVGLVYIDVTGVSRRAVIKSVAKGMVVGKVKGGGEVVVGEGDGGAVSEADQKRVEAEGGAGGAALPPMSASGGQASSFGPSSSATWGQSQPQPPAYESQNSGKEFYGGEEKK